MEPTVLPPARPPFPVAAPYRVVPAPQPVEGPPTVELDDAWPTALTRRLERLSADRAGVVVRAPGQHQGDDGLLAAMRRAWDLLPLPRHGDVVDVPLLGVRVDLAATTCARTGSTCSPEATGLMVGLQGLELLVVGWMLACSDDLVVLRRHAVGVLRAELLAVSFQSGWPVRERAGATLFELHGPVADGERLQRAAPALSEALLTKGPLRQAVWGLNPDGRLDRDPSAPDVGTAAPPEDPARWWLRVERQTSVPLPELDRGLFTIRPFLLPLTSLTQAQRTSIGDAVASMSPEALAYKGISQIAPDLVAWCRRLS